MTLQADCVVIGAGAIGLAIARALAVAGREVVIVEAAGAIGTGVSSRSSEVIHAGLYYPPASLKARLCVAGRRALYDYCASHGIGCRRIGKLVVATGGDEEPALEALARRGIGNGVEGLELLDAAAARRREPELQCTAALWSPESGIFDSHALMLALQGEAEDRGASIAFRTRVTGARVTRGRICLEASDLDGRRMTVAARVVVNAAGLGAWEVAAGIDAMPAHLIPPRHLSRGHYFAATRPVPFHHLVYPLPDAAGLGIHLTFDLGGQARFGPDAEWVDDIDYALPDDDMAARRRRFAAAVRRYYPGLGDDDLAPAYAGIRPKVQAPGEPPADFVIQGPETHGIAGLVNLFGIESPGLTACLAIADHVAGLIAESGHG